MSLRRLQPVRTLAVACAVGLLIAFAVAVPARAALPLQMGELADPAATRAEVAAATERSRTGITSVCLGRGRPPAMVLGFR